MDMKIVCIADTHGQHNNIRVPDGDVLIIAGDVTVDAGQADLRLFARWLHQLPHKHKILIAGNHDWAFEKWPDLAKALLSQHAPDVHYLQDSGVTIEGVKFWGSPVQPWFLDWAFNRQRGADIKRHWDLIPDDTEVLVTHGPAHGHLDLVLRPKGTHQGCEELTKAINERLRGLRLHVFGHLHLQGGQTKVEDSVLYVNAAVVNESYQPVHPIITVETIDLPERAINFNNHEQTR